MKKLLLLINDQKGIQHAEEALLLALLAVAVTTIVVNFASAVGGVFTDAGVQIQDSIPSG